VAPTVQILTQWTTRYGAKCSSGRVYQTKVLDLIELKQRLIDVWHCWGQNIIDDAIDEWRKHLRACIRVKKRKHLRACKMKKSPEISRTTGSSC